MSSGSHDCSPDDSEAMEHIRSWTGGELDPQSQEQHSVSLDSLTFVLKQVNRFVKENNTNIRELKNLLNDNLDEKAYDLLEDPIFDRDQMLGKGHYSMIFSGSYLGQPVAVKEFEIDVQSKNQRLSVIDLRKEILIHQRLCKLPGVIGFFGAKLFSIPRVMALEKADDNLYDAVHSKTCPFTITLSHKLDMLYQVATTLSAVHKLNVLHCDVKPLNILLFYSPDRKITAKLCDFGLAKHLNESSGCTKDIPQGTLAYMAPEVLEGRYYCSSDVYSFGIMLNEILSEKDPYDNIQQQTSLPFKVIRGFRPELYSCSEYKIQHEVLALRDLIENCWHMESSRRPTFHAIAHQLLDIQRSLTMKVPSEPIKPFTLTNKNVQNDKLRNSNSSGNSSRSGSKKKSCEWMVRAYVFALVIAFIFIYSLLNFDWRAKFGVVKPDEFSSFQYTTLTK